MVWCKNCGKNTASHNMDTFICCADCGRVINQDNFSEEPTFTKNAAGQSQLSGRYVKTVGTDISVSRERTISRAESDIDYMASAIGIFGGDSIVRQALAFYTIALERNFTKGRRSDQVHAACLYIACRENKKPFLLIDFSEHLKINVYVLGAVFLQLCQLLRLEEHPIVQKPVDPSLFIHKFTSGLSLPREMNNQVSRTALRIVASMKRDWMQTGRKPSGLCGAALYIAALSYGLKCSKTDIVSVVHICEATLTKRLIEFENTKSGSLTIEEFNEKAAELEREYVLNKQPSISGTSELLCEHKDSGKPHFAHGLCEDCYDDFINLSGGLDGEDPPAFQRAEMDRQLALTEDNANDLQYEQLQFEKELDSNNASGNEYFLSQESPAVGAFSKDAYDTLHGVDGANTEVHNESESLSDIDDIEVDGYLHNEEEKHYKKIIWEEMNKEYLEEQAAKEAAAAAAKKAFEANFDCSEELHAAQELVAATDALLAKSRKERQRKRAEEARNATPAQTPAEATQQMLAKKNLSKRVNLDVLKNLFDERVDTEIPKKRRIESDDNGYDNKNNKSLGTIKEAESEYAEDEDFEVQHGDNGYDLYNENAEEENGYCDYDYNEY